MIGGEGVILIDEAVLAYVKDCLDELDWFDTNRQTLPITLVDGEVEPTEKTVDNLVALSSEDNNTDDMEMGSNLAEQRRQFYLDVFGANLSVAKRITYDLRDIMQFRFGFQARAVIPVIDFTLATPTEVFAVGVENVMVDRSRLYEREYKKFWYQIAFDIVDWYGSEESQ